MSVGLVTALLFAAISINMRSVECSIKTAEASTSQSEKILSVQGRYIWSIVEMAMTVRRVIYLDTKWCGDRRTGEHYNDFGESVATDHCCREYYYCWPSISEGSYNGLTDTVTYIVSDCDCDNKLLDCLVDVATSKNTPDYDAKTARDFGNLFFNLIRRKCLEEDYPLVCVNRELNGTCINYEKDTNQTKVLQLVEGPTFTVQ